eukprot:TRINITY_DN1845_c0_g2_i1.p1 TRINITY_DN1845_c0_g2~~TRINITY_DN1845_c0_g2_i1.p1  ORF type:complete len:530 (+),score=59.12 TRINITY_DN1845_c0_g2_i1:42-1631(+)
MKYMLAVVLAVVFMALTVQSAVITQVLSLDLVQACPDTVCRQAIGCNNVFPCPPIYMNLGDTLSVTFINNLLAPTSVHFHGIFQTNSVEMDGSGIISQCEIKPGASFTYTFTPSQTGTYWYHSHSSTQYVDGLRGSLVIFNPANTFNYQFQSLVEVYDWYHSPSSALLPGYLASLTGNEPVPESILLNGVGQFGCISCPYSKIEVPQNSVIRLRVVNQAAMAIISFSIDGFQLTVIEVDGVEVNPATFDVIRLNAAQRYSVLVTANKPVGTYLMRAEMDPTVFFAPPVNPIALGNFVVVAGATPVSTTPVVTAPVLNPVVLSGNPIIPPTIVNPNAIPFVESPTVLSPLIPIPVPPLRTTYPVELTFAPSLSHGGANRGLLNGIHFAPPTNAAFLEYIRADVPLPPGANARTFALNEVVDIILFNNDPGEHPFHLHGHPFWVVGMGNVGDGPYEGQPLDLVAPIVRDTASVNADSWLVLRVLFNNPGVWPFHCHIDWHLENGLLLTAIVAPELVRARLGATPALVTCPP